MDSRIKAVMDFVRAGNRVADIGADHGYLSIELVKNNLAAKVIATEKNIYPFEFLSKNISGFNRIEARRGDGLKVLSAGEVDTICIAGMGGALIVKILEESPEVVQSARQIILQPMNSIKKVREYLAEQNFTIIDEDLAESAGIIYEIICAEKNSEPKEIFKREKSPLLKKFRIQRLEKLEKVLFEMGKSISAQKSEKYLALRAEIDTLQRLC